MTLTISRGIDGVHGNGAGSLDSVDSVACPEGGA